MQKLLRFEVKLGFTFPDCMVSLTWERRSSLYVASSRNAETNFDMIGPVINLARIVKKNKVNYYCDCDIQNHQAKGERKGVYI